MSEVIFGSSVPCGCQQCGIAAPAFVGPPPCPLPCTPAMYCNPFMETSLPRSIGSERPRDFGLASNVSVNAMEARVSYGNSLSAITLYAICLVSTGS